MDKELNSENSDSDSEINIQKRTILRERLRKTGQEHLLQFSEYLDKEVKHEYIDRLNSYDFESAVDLFKAAADTVKNFEKLDNKMSPLAEGMTQSEETCTPETLAQYRIRGLTEISNKKVAVVLMAGGQATRLGVVYPKGMHKVGLLSEKSLFQLQGERIYKLQELAEQESGVSGAAITWYIMASEASGRPTREYFVENDHFGLDPKNVVIFEQGEFPCFDFNGKILMSDINMMSFAPNGNGGLYKALKEKGILVDMERRGIQYVHVHSVDNILVKIADPIFIGYCVESNVECAAKAVIKTDPNEKIGVICQVDDKIKVVEYSEISQETANARDEFGNLIFKSGNICNHFFTTPFLNRIASQHLSNFPLHIARKKIPYINSTGQSVKPDSENGIKIEMFVFDVFQFAESFAVWEVQREVEFSPVKNSDDAGKDCSSTALKDLYALHKKWVEKAGGVVNGDEIEISPLTSYAGEDLEWLCQGKTFNCPILLPE